MKRIKNKLTANRTEGKVSGDDEKSDNASTIVAKEPFLLEDMALRVPRGKPCTHSRKPG